MLPPPPLRSQGPGEGMAPPDRCFRRKRLNSTRKCTHLLACFRLCPFIRHPSPRAGVGNSTPRSQCFCVCEAWMPARGSQSCAPGRKLMLMDASKERGAEMAEISRTSRPVMCFCLHLRLHLCKRQISWRTQPGYHQGQGLGGQRGASKKRSLVPEKHPTAAGVTH